MKIRLVSWNVAGMRASIKKGLWQFMKEDKADIYCLQETKVKIDQIPHSEEEPTGYNFYLNSAEKAGYSGVATYSKLEPRSVILGDPESNWDDEGRLLMTKFDEFTLINVYFPNGGRDKGRLFFKLKFYEHFLKYINELREHGEKVIFCGDVNTAHHEIDLARPKENVKTSGFMPEERAWLDKWEMEGWIDTYRMKHPDEVTYSWWDQKSGARQRNVGWRIDYVYVDEKIKDKVKEAFMMPDMIGSDHCPVGIELEL